MAAVALIVSMACGLQQLTPVSMTTYKGGLLGVTANALLNGHRALITLSGLPFGGTITGEATFLEEGIGGPVKIGEPLASALRLRGISIKSVHQVSNREISVVLGLPIFGDRTVHLVAET